MISSTAPTFVYDQVAVQTAFEQYHKILCKNNATINEREQAGILFRAELEKQRLAFFAANIQPALNMLDHPAIYQDRDALLPIRFYHASQSYAKTPPLEIMSRVKVKDWVYYFCFDWLKGPDVAEEFRKNSLPLDLCQGPGALSIIELDERPVCLHRVDAASTKKVEEALIETITRIVYRTHPLRPMSEIKEDKVVDFSAFAHSRRAEKPLTPR